MMLARILVRAGCWRSHARSATTLGTATALGNMGIVAVANDEPARQSSCSRKALRSASAPVSIRTGHARDRLSARRSRICGDTGLAATHLVARSDDASEAGGSWLRDRGHARGSWAAFAVGCSATAERAAAQVGAASCASATGSRAPVDAVRRRQALADRVHSLAISSARSSTTSRIDDGRNHREPDVAVEAALARSRRRIAAATGGSASVD